MNTKKNHRKQTKIKSGKLITKKNSKKKYLRQIGGSLSPEDELKKLKIELIKRNELIKYIKKRLNEEEIQKETQEYTLTLDNSELGFDISCKENKSQPGIEGIFITQIESGGVAETNEVLLHSQIIEFNSKSCINMTKAEFSDILNFWKQQAQSNNTVKIKCTKTILDVFQVEIEQGTEIHEKIILGYNEEDGLYFHKQEGYYQNVTPDNSIVIQIVCEYQSGGKAEKITFYNYQNIEFVQTEINYLSNRHSVTLKILYKKMTHHFC